MFEAIRSCYRTVLTEDAILDSELTMEERLRRIEIEMYRTVSAVRAMTRRADPEQL